MAKDARPGARRRWLAIAEHRAGVQRWTPARPRLAIHPDTLNALQFITVVAQLLLAAILLPVLAQAVRRRTRTWIDIALFFALLDLLLLRSVLGLADVPVLGPISETLAYALPYLMLRLLIDFSSVPLLIVRATEVAFGVLFVGAFVYPAGSAVPAPVTTVRALYFVLPFVYAAVAFARLAGRSSGVTRRRMQSISTGNILFGAVVAGSAALTIFPALAQPATLVIQPGILATALAWLVGFAPPAALRRYWQEPELRAFLTDSGALPRLPNIENTVRELERRASAATGALATIGLWNEERGVLVFMRSAPSTETVEVKPGELAGGRSFAEQRPLFTENPSKDHPEGAAIYRASGVGAAIAAPITSGERRLGVLCAYAARPPIFAESDIELVSLLADQAAVVLESRILIKEASQAQAHEEAARLKEEFVSAAAHDLKTPLTALFGRAQLLQRQVRQGHMPEASSTDRIVGDARRLTMLVDELLDASRIGQGLLRLRPESIDLNVVIRELHAHREDWVRVRLHVGSALPGLFDRARIEQVIDNLVENALKYSGDEEPVLISADREGDLAHLTVHDEGIGIPPDDLESVFERFRRGSNVEDRYFSGMGLGLFICRGIVEQHGGRIWAESMLGKGTTMHVTLPLVEGDLTK